MLPRLTLVFSVLVSLLAVHAPAAEQARRPNIVFILADDLGWTDLGCQGSKYYVTPNIDRLAADGMRFTDAYTCGPNCQPTRAALLSGQYGPRTGVYTVGGIGRFNWQSRPLRPVDNVTKLPLEKITVAQALKQAGYATGMFGKWHLGNDAEHHPSRRGFDEAIESSGRHFNFATDPKQKVPEGTYLADWLTDRAVDFIRRHKDEPFFLYLPHFGVHSPHEAKEEIIARFKDKPAAGGHHSPVYAAMIASVDESVGRLMATLKELNLQQNTLVIFTADNGGVGGYAAAGVMRNNGITDNAPLRGGKGMLYEGGVRVAFMARWPGVIAQGKTCGTPILSVDMYPTLLEVAGVSPPKDYTLDGLSILPVLKSDGRMNLDRPLFWHFPGYLGAGMDSWRTTPAGAIRHGDWKLLEFFEDGRLELYNLAQDIGQKRDLATSEPQRLKALHDELVAWRKAVNAPMPTPNKRRVAASASK
jgi:arylsulfatase A-like enzyme